MNASNWVLLGGVLATFATGVTGYAKSRQNAGKIHEVHILVNSQLSAVTARVTQLITTLEKAGVPVPPNTNGGEPGIPPPPPQNP